MGTWGSANVVNADPEVATAIEKDLDTPRAILRLRAIEKDSHISPQDKRAIFLHADQVLGLELTRAAIDKPLSPEQALLLSQRASARELKNWSQSDLLRDELLAQGISISDGPAGQSWSWV